MSELNLSIYDRDLDVDGVILVVKFFHRFYKLAYHPHVDVNVALLQNALNFVALEVHGCGFALDKSLEGTVHDSFGEDELEVAIWFLKIDSAILREVAFGASSVVELSKEKEVQVVFRNHWRLYSPEVECKLVIADQLAISDREIKLEVVESEVDDRAHG